MEPPASRKQAGNVKTKTFHRDEKLPFWQWTNVGTPKSRKIRVTLPTPNHSIKLNDFSRTDNSPME